MNIKNDPVALLLYQIGAFYGEKARQKARNPIEAVYSSSLEKLKYSFSFVANKYYREGEDILFNPLHGVQWFIFLYTVSRELFCSRDTNDYNIEICDMIYNINRFCSSADLFYGVQMPDIWFCDHPMGSVIGRAKYGNFLFFSQGCTIGGNHSIYPRLGDHISLFSDAKIIGNCEIGDYVIFSANSYVKDINIPSNTMVFGQGENIVFKTISTEDFYGYTSAQFAKSKKGTGFGE